MSFNLLCSFPATAASLLGQLVLLLLSCIFIFSLKVSFECDEFCSLGSLQCISNKTVDNSVTDNLSLPIAFFKHFFIILTNLSQNSPHQGAPPKLKFHVSPPFKTKQLTVCDLNTAPLFNILWTTSHYNKFFDTVHEVLATIVFN